MKLKDDKICNLLQMIGSPFSDGRIRDPQESKRLFEISFKNRIAFLYLWKLHETGRLDFLRSEYERNLRRYIQLYEDLSRLLPVLDGLGMSYALVKTLRQYPENPNDIDILLFEDLHTNLTAITKDLEGIGYRKYAKGNNTYNFGRVGKVGFWDYKRIGPKSKTSNALVWFDLDIYGEIMVEEFVHGDITLMANDVVTEAYTNVVDGRTLNARVLNPAADLFYVYFHSIFPTRNIGLEVFYTTLHDLLYFRETDYRRFAELARNSRLKKEIGYSLRLVADLYRTAFGVNCDRLEMLLDVLSDRSMGVREEVDFPYVYPTSFFVSAGIKTSFHKKGVQSLLAVFLKSLYPPYAANIIREVLSKKLAKKRYNLKYDDYSSSAP